MTLRRPAKRPGLPTGLPLCFVGALTASSRRFGRVGCLSAASSPLWARWLPRCRVDLRKSSLLRPCSVASLWRATAQALWTISQRIQFEPNARLRKMTSRGCPRTPSSRSTRYFLAARDLLAASKTLGMSRLWKQAIGRPRRGFGPLLHACFQS